jgi:hypothetical protein
MRPNVHAVRAPAFNETVRGAFPNTTVVGEVAPRRRQRRDRDRRRRPAPSVAAIGRLLIDGDSVVGIGTVIDRRA